MSCYTDILNVKALNEKTNLKWMTAGETYYHIWRNMLLYPGMDPSLLEMNDNVEILAAVIRKRLATNNI